MVDKDKLAELGRNAAAVDIFSHMATPEKANALAEKIRAFPDKLLDSMARISGVPDDQLHIHHAMVRGEDNVFMNELGKVDGLLQAGDVILMTGKSSASKALVNAQKATYSNARSSHVALVHADLICIDAMPKLGVSNRIISEVLSDVETDWRVIRHREVTPGNVETMARACVFYLAQPYKIRPSGKTAKKFSYCSELARKVYSHSGVTATGVPSSLIIKPADFDRLADKHAQWLDVTETVRPAIDFCRRYPELVKVSTKLFIDGLLLNRKRFEERTAQLSFVQAAAKSGRITREQALEATKAIKDLENNLNNTFWDVRRSA